MKAKFKDLEQELQNLKDPYSNEGLKEVDTNQINELHKQLEIKLEEVYSNLNPWQKTFTCKT